MQENPGFEPIFRTTRNGLVDSIFFGAIAVVTPGGALLAHHGNPAAVSFLRSAAKPFQTIPLVEQGGQEAFRLISQELAILCASHSGTDAHLAILTTLQDKIGFQLSDLNCGSHPPFHQPTRAALKDRGQSPTPNHHNCSGKHTGMLGQARLLGAALDGYEKADHPVQRQIKRLIREICSLDADQLSTGIDGCSVPTFAMPLENAARGWARLMDPSALSKERAAACRTITSAMIAHPWIVAGPGRLDTELIRAGNGKIAAKGGAEGIQALGIKKNACAPGSSALGILLKIAQGDPGKQVMKGVVWETLRQLRVLSKQELEDLGCSDTGFQVETNRGKAVGQGEACFELRFH